MPEKQISPRIKGGDRLVALDRNAAGGENVERFARQVGIDENIDIHIQGAPGGGVEAKRKGAADGVVDARRGKQARHFHRQFRRRQGRFRSRHRRFSRARIAG